MPPARTTRCSLSSPLSLTPHPSPLHPSTPPPLAPPHLTPHPSCLPRPAQDLERSITDWKEYIVAEHKATLKMRKHRSLNSVLRWRKNVREKSAPSSLKAPMRHEGSKPQLLRLSTRQYPQLAAMSHHYSNARSSSLKHVGDVLTNLSPSRCTEHQPGFRSPSKASSCGAPSKASSCG